MIEFKPNKLTINNFRGIPLFELDIVDKTPTYLIGPNNAGKSTILQAIAFAFKAGGFHKFTPNTYDFYHKNNNEKENKFTIQIDFRSSDQLPSVHTVGPVKEVHSVQVVGKYYKTSDRMEHSHRLLDENGKSIVLATETNLTTKDSKEFDDVGHGFKNRNARLSDIRNHTPDVWFLTASNLYSSLYTWKTGPLNKLAKILSQKFFEENWEFTYGEEKRKMPKGIQQAHDFFSAAVKDFPYWKNSLKPALENSLSTYLGKQTSIELNPLIQSIEEWLQQQLILSFAAEMGTVFTPLDRMGDGFQSIVRLAALEVLADMEEATKDNVIVLYEEPESYLHPHLKRKLRNIFDKLANRGWNIFSATHAPEYISFEKKQNVNRIFRAGNTIEHGHMLTTSISNNLKLQEKLDEYGNHEIFFAQKIILCEGKDDLFAIKTFIELSNIDIEAMSISILSCSGIENIPDFAEIAKNMKIPFCAVTDTDIDVSGKVKEKTNKSRAKISTIQSSKDKMIEWDNDLEDCLQTPLKQNSTNRKKALPEWQRDNVFAQPFDEIKTKYPKYKNVCEAIISWINNANQNEV
jgi:predicted ATP-dependent endonuclease of OLD family